MNLQHRIYLVSRLGDYLESNSPDWRQVVEKAGYENGWFTPGFVDSAVQNIRFSFLQKEKLEKWADENHVPEINPNPKKVGIIMAGNIPLVGFHDWLAVFISGHKSVIKLSSRDQVLFKHLLGLLIKWEPEMAAFNTIEEMLKGCDAYIATGSNNSSRYFDYYFSKYPHIIRKNRTSVAILSGQETASDLDALADDIHLYFGLGCRNVTKIYVPGEYDFVPLLNAFNKYSYLADHHKYKNNYDYNLALHLLNNKYYMTNGTILLVEEESLFSPISQLNYGYYEDRVKLTESLQNHPDLQCITGSGFTKPGSNQSPGLNDFADNVNTLHFLNAL